jgi:hypothetical protein
MAKKFRIAVSNIVTVLVAATIADEGGKPVKHKFKLTCERRGAEEMKEQLDSNFNVKTFMKEVTTGWEDQRLVLDEDGKPADFELDALDALLDISGLAMVCFVAYGNAAAAQGKN